MTTHERMKRMYEHREADRVPVTDGPWPSTVMRWRREGLPEGVSYVDFFGLDRFVGIGADNSPRYPERVIEETDEYTVTTTSWGATARNWKHAGGVPEFLDFTVKDPDSWARTRERMKPDRDRVDWDHLKRHYARWRREGAWISASFWFGFDVAHAWMVGTERLLTALATDPEWVTNIFNHYLDVHLALFQMVWDAGYEFDEIAWPDDMGYKQHTFFSVNMYRELLKPVHRRAIEWAHARGIKARLHSCGFVKPLIPDLIDAGVDMLNPLEVKAGMDPIALKDEFGDKLGLQGGLNALLYNDPERMFSEMERVIPHMKRNGGYVAGTDHSVPDCVSLKDFRHFVELCRRLGSYE